MSTYVYEDEVQKIWDEKKLAAINLIKTNYPTIAPNILNNLLFENHFMFGVTERNGKQYPSTFPEFMQLEMKYEYMNHVSTKLYNNYLSLALEFAKEDYGELKQLIVNLGNCSENLIDDIIKLLDSELVKNLDNEKLYTLWSELKSFITKNRYFKSAKWAKDEACLNRIEIAANHIAPKNKALKVSWYFVNNDIVEVPCNSDDFDYDEEEKIRSELRKDQINSLISSDGIDSIVTLYEICKESCNFDVYSLADTLSQMNNTEIDNILLDKFLCSESDRYFIANYINKRFNDEQNATHFIDEVKNDWSKDQLCNFVSALSFKLPNEKLSSLLEDCERSYWLKVYIITSDTEVLEKYLINERYDLLFHCFNVYANDINSDIIINALNKVLSLEKLPVNWSLINKQVKRVIMTESIETSVKENLEWLSLRFYSPYSNSFIPKTLFGKLDRDNQYLCDIINQAYKLSTQFKKGQANYLLWLWCPNFENIPVFYDY